MATFLAAAGLKRLGLADKITSLVPTDVMLPAVAQGCIGIETREDDAKTRELLAAYWDGRDYYLVSQSGYKRRSTITDCEDVSYVSSAYIPQCLRYGGRPTLSNAHRAHESGVSSDGIQNELDEVITLNSVSVIVAEYIPFGANQIVQLNNNVGSTERCQGGFISPAVDDHAADTSIQMSPELTSVDILDYTLTNHIN
jgi:WD repeat-containing protein 35